MSSLIIKWKTVKAEKHIANWDLAQAGSEEISQNKCDLSEIPKGVKR